MDSAFDEAAPQPDPADVVVFKARNGGRAGEAAACLRSFGIDAQWRSVGPECVVTVPPHAREEAIETILREGIDQPTMGDRLIHLAAWAVLALLALTGILVAIRL